MINREAVIVSLSFQGQPKDKIINRVEEEAKKGCDMIVLPETWTGDIPETIDDTTARLQAIAGEFGVYIINAVALKGVYPRSNSAILINRSGEIQGIYNKMYPYWSEFDLKPQIFIGENAPVFETDFGRVGMAICFDANFNCVWEELGNHNADIVLWSSAYSAGTTLQAHALNYNYAIVSSTLACDCVVYDINGEEIFYDKAEENEILVSRVAVNTNRALFHENFNIEKRSKLLSKYPETVILEKSMPREQWFILKGRDGAQVKALAAEFGMEELRDYRRRSRTEIDRLRHKQKNV